MCPYLCIYKYMETYIHKNIKNPDSQAARTPTDPHGPPRTATGPEKAVFFLVSPISKYHFKGKNTRINPSFGIFGAGWWLLLICGH